MPKTQNQNPSNNWVFLPIKKGCIAKRTDTFILIKLAQGKSVILNTKFVREKETEEFIYASVPSDYTFLMRATRYDEEQKKFVVVSEDKIDGEMLLHYIREIEVACKQGHELKEVLDYYFMR